MTLREPTRGYADQLEGRLRRYPGRDIPVVEGDRRPGDPPYLVAAPGRAHETLGWQPQLTGLDDIIGTAWAWHQRGGQD